MLTKGINTGVSGIIRFERKFFCVETIQRERIIPRLLVNQRHDTLYAFAQFETELYHFIFQMRLIIKLKLLNVAISR